MALVFRYHDAVRFYGDLDTLYRVGAQGQAIAAWAFLKRFPASCHLSHRASLSITREALHCLWVIATARSLQSLSYISPNGWPRQEVLGMQVAR